MGGGIFINRGSAQILNSRIVGNRANWSAGLRIINNADVSLIGNEIRDNVAQAWGGGVDVDCCGDTAPLIARNRIVDNDGGHAGGGVRVESTNVRLVNGGASYPVDAALIHNTLVGRSSEGEGIWADAYVTATLVNDLLAGYAVGITSTAPSSSTLSVDHSLFWNADDPIVGTNAVRADPLLDATYHLTAGSPARDAGAVVDVSSDIDGDPRPVGDYDIGADEYALQGFLPVLLMDHMDDKGG
jgi:hypothetical protein